MVNLDFDYNGNIDYYDYFISKIIIVIKMINLTFWNI